MFKCKCEKCGVRLVLDKDTIIEREVKEPIRLKVTLVKCNHCGVSVIMQLDNSDTISMVNQIIRILSEKMTGVHTISKKRNEKRKNLYNRLNKTLDKTRKELMAKYSEEVKRELEKDVTLGDVVVFNSLGV